MDRKMISPLDRWYSRACCCYCHVRTGTIILGIWCMLVISAAFLYLLITLARAVRDNDLDVMHNAYIWFSTAASPFGMLICGMAAYGAYKLHAPLIIPFFCYRIFDFAFYFVLQCNVTIYPSTVRDFLRQLPGNFTYKEEIESMNSVSLISSIQVFIIFIVVIKAYLLVCVWTCYKYLIGRGTTRVLVPVTTNDTTVSGK